MITKQNDIVAVNEHGLVSVCSYCTPMERIQELCRTHECSHGICPPCVELFERDCA